MANHRVRCSYRAGTATACTAAAVALVDSHRYHGAACPRHRAAVAKEAGDDATLTDLPDPDEAPLFPQP